MSKIEEFDKNGSMALHDIPLLIDEYKAALAEKDKTVAVQIQQVVERIGDDLKHQLAEKERELEQVVGEAVWAMGLILSDYLEGCSAWCNATEFLNGPIVQAYLKRQEG